MKTRKTIPKEIESEVLFRSNLKCCIDQKRGDHIHHLDEDPANNEFDNLVFLCFDCHNEATVTNSLRKTLTEKTIRKFRDLHYEQVESQRAAVINKMDHPISKLSESVLLDAAMDALILLDIEKIKKEFGAANLSDRQKILKKLDVYEKYNSSRISYEILTLLLSASYTTRDNMSNQLASQIHFLVVSFLPVPGTKSQAKDKVELGWQALQVSSNMFYDSVIHLRNLTITQWALLTFKYVYWYAKRENIKPLSKKVNETLHELEEYLVRPERTDLGYARELLEVYKKDLINKSISFVPLPIHLSTAIDHYHTSQTNSE